MNERDTGAPSAESIEQKWKTVEAWAEEISRNHEVKEIKPGILKDVLVDCGADFDNLSVEGSRGLSMYNEGKRTLGAEEIWGEILTTYDNWTEDCVPKYESELGKPMAKMINVANLVNEDRKASESKNVGMKSFLRDITAYAAGSLSFDDLKLILEARAENGFIGAMTKEEKERIKAETGEEVKKTIIPWDREIDPKKGPLTKDPRESKLHPGEFIPEDKQEIKVASFPPGFPTVALNWLRNN